MKELNILTSLTNINDTWIDEAAEMPVAVAVAPRRSFGRRLSDAANSPVGVALICGVVALGVLAGIIAAGRNAPNTPTVNPPAGGSVSNPSNQTEPSNSLDLVPPDTAEVEATLRPPLTDSSPNFDFSFTIDEGGVFKRGTTYNITTTLTNVGKAFTYSGSSTDFFAEATLLYHSGQTYAVEHAIGYEIQGMFPITDDYVENYEVVQGKTANRTGHFIIPDTAPTGQYDLKLSYKGEYVIYKNAVSIYSEERFAFAYEGIDHFSDGKVYAAGGNLKISASVTNIGDAFMVYEDHSDSFVPMVKFVCRATGYTIHATTSQSDDITTFEVAKGQVGKTFYFADIPEDADAGVYDLVLSYSNESRTFYEVIQVVRWDKTQSPLVPHRDNVESIAVTSFPAGVEHSFEGTKATRIMDYLLDLHLISNFEENPDEYDGASYEILISYKDGTSVTLYHFGNMFIRAADDRWYKMEIREAALFEKLLSQLSQEPPSSSPAFERPTSITLGNRTVTLSYVTTYQAYSSDPYVDQYLGSDGVLYEFHKDTSKLYKFRNPDIRDGSDNGTTEISREEARKLADAFFSDYSIIPDMSQYDVEESGSAKNGFHFTYKHHLGKTDTWYELMLSINKHGDVYSFSSISWCENLPYITEEDIEAAKVRFCKKYPQFASGYSVYPYGGMLCVVYEDIVTLPPPPIVTDEDGNGYQEGGCGFDHEHVFYKEEVRHES